MLFLIPMVDGRLRELGTLGLLYAPLPKKMPSILPVALRGTKVLNSLYIALMAKSGIRILTEKILSRRKDNVRERGMS